jgi:5-hydroxyisourate hydrolase
MPVVAHVRDLNGGCPAAEVQVRLEARLDGRWQPVTTRRTNETGWCEFGAAAISDRGTYRLVYETDPYFVGLGAAPAYPEVVVVFRVLDISHHGHIMILVSPAGYTAYLGR